MIMTTTEKQDGIERDIREFVITNFLFGVDDNRITPDESFLESGIIDSTGVLELVGFLEQTWDIKVRDEELVPENLDSLRKVSAFVGRKLGQ
jgi:acyl carrier protein